MEKFFLIDASYLFYRAYYGANGAVAGFKTYLEKLMAEKPQYMALCLDTGAPSFRSEIYDSYKANRAPMPAQLAVQLPILRALIAELGLATVSLMHFEADDLVATLAHFGRQHNLEVTIVSADKDFCQLIGPAVRLYDVTTDRVYDEAAVFAKWGVKPCQFVDYLALVGDSSDEIPGVAGIGHRGAVKLLSQFGNLAAIYSNTSDIKNENVRAKVVAGRESAFLSQKLATLMCDCDINRSIEAYRIMA